MCFHSDRLKMIGRAIVNKHRAYTFHRPSALWLAQIMVDLSFAAVQIFVFSVMVYFMCHLVRDAGAFFTFYLVIVCGYLVMTLFFRVIGTVTPDCKFFLDLAMGYELTEPSQSTTRSSSRLASSHSWCSLPAT